VSGRRRPILEVLHDQGIGSDEAARLIREHRVVAAGRPILQVGSLVGAGEAVEVRARAGWRPRGWQKLDGALVAWGIDVKDRVCLDLGSSTGGFVMALRDRGARMVVAVERGQHQLDASLRSDPRVRVHESVDLRDFSWPYAGAPEIVTADLSWVSLCEVMGHIRRLASEADEVIVLVKPQFELGARARDRGVVRDETLRMAAVAQVRECARMAGATVWGLLPAPLRGTKGNQEYLLRMRFEANPRGELALEDRIGQQ